MANKGAKTILNINDEEIEQIKRTSKNKKKHNQVSITRVFGNKIDFGEKTLLTNIDPKEIKTSLMNLYNLTKLTRNTLKAILREGARDNNIMRVTDDWFSRMVEILDIPFDWDTECNSSYASSELSEDHVSIKKREVSYSMNAFHKHSFFPEDISNNKLLQATEILENIQRLELLDVDEDDDANKKSKTKIKPTNLSPEKIDELKKLK